MMNAKFDFYKVSFTLASKSMKYLQINLSVCVRLLSLLLKTLLRDIKGALNK